MRHLDRPQTPPWSVTLKFQWYCVWPGNTFASHFHRWQQQHRLVHSGGARVWPRARPVAFVLRSVHHEAILPGLCGGRFHVQTGLGWQAGYPAAVRSVSICADTTIPSGITRFFHDSIKLFQNVQKKSVQTKQKNHADLKWGTGNAAMRAHQEKKEEILVKKTTISVFFW